MPKTSESALPRIVIDGVQKTYTLRHTHSFKESFVARLRRKRTSTSFTR